MEKIIINLIKLQLQLRVHHWQTSKFSEHEAFGQAYSDLDGLIDTLVETHQGKHGKIIFDEENSRIDLLNYDDVSIMDVLDEFSKYLTTVFSEHHDSEVDVDCLSIRDDILIIVNKLKYLLTLQ